MNFRNLLRISKFTIPVLLGYIPIGIAFGLLAVNSGYPVWLPVFMSIVVFAGAAQFIAVGLFVSGASLFQIAVVTLVVNVRHIAYGFSLIRDFARFPRLRPYLVFALSDETYALLTSLPAEDRASAGNLSGIAALDQFWWVLGTVIGASIGSLIPFKLQGLDFALTALFIVLAIEQFWRVRTAVPAVIATISTCLAALLAGTKATIVVAMLVSVVLLALLELLNGSGPSQASSTRTHAGRKKHES